MKAKGSLIKQEVEMDANLKEVSNFFEDVIPDFVREGGGILTDSVRFWRWKNQVNIVKKAKDKIEKSGLSKKQVPLKILYPLLENASLEEDENIKNKWSNLIANAVAGEIDINPNYVEILKELSSLEVIILDQLFVEVSKEEDYEKRKAIVFSKDKLKEIFILSNEKADLIIENLYRLNLCQSPSSRGGVSIGDYPIVIRTNDVFEFTTFGYCFVKACKWE